MPDCAAFCNRNPRAEKNKVGRPCPRVKGRSDDRRFGSCVQCPGYGSQIRVGSRVHCPPGVSKTRSLTCLFPACGGKKTANRSPPRTLSPSFFRLTNPRGRCKIKGEKAKTRTWARRGPVRERGKGESPHGPPCAAYHRRARGRTPAGPGRYPRNEGRRSFLRRNPGGTVGHSGRAQARFWAHPDAGMGPFCLLLQPLPQAPRL